MKRIFLLLSLLIVFIGCSEKQPAKNESKLIQEEIKTLRDEIKTIQEETKLVAEENTWTFIEIDTTYFGPCKANVKYTVFPHCPKLSAAIKADVDEYLNQLLQESNNRAKAGHDPDPEICENCELYIQSSVSRADDNFVSIVLSGSMDLSLHPVSFTREYNYDVRSDKSLDINDLFNLNSSENITCFNSLLEQNMSGLNCEAFDRPWGEVWALQANLDEKDRTCQKPTIENMDGFSFSNDTFYAYYGQYAFGFNAFTCTCVSISLESLRPIMKTPF